MVAGSGEGGAVSFRGRGVSVFGVRLCCLVCRMADLVGPANVAGSQTVFFICLALAGGMSPRTVGLPPIGHRFGLGLPSCGLDFRVSGIRFPVDFRKNANNGTLSMYRVLTAASMICFFLVTLCSGVPTKERLEFTVRGVC